MFTGIIEEMGTVKSITVSDKSAILEINAKSILEDCHIGDSIAVNGVCLTVCDFDRNSFKADVMPETLRKSNLGLLKKGSFVNLERAMKADGRFGGHFVSGHIDGKGEIISLKAEGNAVWVEINVCKEILDLIVIKGSVAIDGISLTVANLTEKSFAVSVIPHTAENTNLLNKKTGEIVNIENDIISKYVARLTGFDEIKQKNKDKKLMDFLQD